MNMVDVFVGGVVAMLMITAVASCVNKEPEITFGPQVETEKHKTEGGLIEVTRLNDGTRCITYGQNGVSCDWGRNDVIAEDTAAMLQGAEQCVTQEELNAWMKESTPMTEKRPL